MTYEDNFGRSKWHESLPWKWRGCDLHEIGELRVWCFPPRGEKGVRCIEYILQIEDCDDDFVKWYILSDKKIIREGSDQDIGPAMDSLIAAMNELLGYEHFKD